jgi:endonuclease/exonuclease/phosphatase family metal-dependent hydrolase
VAGDFNSVSVYRNDLSEQEKKELEDRGEALRRFIEITKLTNAEGPTPFFTMSSWNPVKKIDHILYDEKSTRLLSVGTVDDLKASDHLPVWGNFKGDRR